MRPEIYIVDDDESVRRAMDRLLRSAGMEPRAFESAEDFFDFKHPVQNACLIVDIKMKGMNGLDLINEIEGRGLKLPVIFKTGFDSPEVREKAKMAGASSYFRKPVDELALLDATYWAVTDQASG
jgi:FixJ family two-component response regulator